jgi:hypothetical protein
MRMTFRRSAALTSLLLLLAFAPPARAQDEAPVYAAEEDTAKVSAPETPTKFNEEKYRNEISGELTPSKGFDIVKTKRGSLNISAYGLFRYVNHLPADQTFEDHLGRTRTVKTRNDINWQRSFIWLTGFLYNPRLRYNISVWGVGTTQQTLIFGNLRYIQSKGMQIGAGVGPNLTNRSMQGSWPFWQGSDRQLLEESLRGGFSTTFFVTGEPINRFNYNVSLTNNLSTLGIKASDDTRTIGLSGSMWIQPTTGEFGPRGGWADFETHEKAATRFGVSGEHIQESRYAPDTSPPNETQIRLSDSVSPFETGALAPGVTVRTLDYDEFSADLGIKSHGWMLSSEFMWRKLSNFAADGPLPDDAIVDKGFMVQAGRMIVPRNLDLHATYGAIDDEFGMKPWELSGGLSFYPYGSRSWRINLHVIRVENSSANSTFGYYTGGQDGTTLSLATDVLI